MKSPNYYTTGSSKHKKSKFSTPIMVCLLAAALLFSGKIISQDAKSILLKMQEKQQERWQGINNYTVTLSLPEAMGMETSVYYQRREGEIPITFQEVPRPLYEREMVIRAGFPPPEEVATAQADALRKYMEFGAPTAGMDFNQMAGFLDAGAAAYGIISDEAAEDEKENGDMQEFIKRAKFVGTEMVRSTSEDKNGKFEQSEAFHLYADNLEDIELEQHEGGGEFTLETTSLFIEKEEFVPLALIMKGNIDSGDGNKTPITISKFDLDYKKVGSLYESYTKAYQIAGIFQAMSKKEQKEMEQAREQLANMTEDQKEIMEKMMPGKMEQLTRMIEGESYNSDMKVTSIAINEGPPAAYGLGSSGTDAALTIAGEGEDDDGNLVAQLSISTGPNSSKELRVSLTGNMLFPIEKTGGTVTVVDADGIVMQNGKQVKIEGGTGNMVVNERTDTHISGIYSASLEFEGGVIPISGNFDSGVPVGPGQAPRGSPVPEWFSDLDD